MPGVTRGEVVSASNPLLFFAYQTDGLLTDIAELELTILELPAGTVRFGPMPLNVTDPPAGVRLGIGRYAASFTSTTAWKIGTHQAVWRYRAIAGGAWGYYRQNFELLEGMDFASGAAYVGYADSCVLHEASPLCNVDSRRIQKLIDVSSRLVERLTGRFFEPRFLTSAYSGPDAPTLLFGHPVIALDSMYELGLGPTDQLFEVDRTALKIFNRHLEGLFDPDDRDNPKIMYTTDILPGRIIAQASFSYGEKNIQVHALFGYTDYDGSPVGSTPRILGRAIGALAARELLDPLGQDASVSTPGRIKMARTRDQAVQFDTGSAQSYGAITGDRLVDDILLPFMRPPHMAAV